MKMDIDLDRSTALYLMASGRRDEGRAGHAALPSLVVDRFEQPAVEGDVDPPLGSPVQQERNQHDVCATAPVGEFRVALDSVD